MKFFSIGIRATALLFGINSVSQNNLKEQLKTLEQSSITTKLDTIVTSNFDLKSTNAYDAFGLNVNQNITSLLTFVGSQKQISTATFETSIKPYLEKIINQSNVSTIDFTDDEDLIFESFINVFDFSNGTNTIQLYEDFIVEKYKNQTGKSLILTVISCIKQLCFYVSKKTTNTFIQFTNNCLQENLKSYNLVNWKIFASNPDAILYWTIATCAWDYKPEK